MRSSLLGRVGPALILVGASVALSQDSEPITLRFRLDQGQVVVHDMHFGLNGTVTVTGEDSDMEQPLDVSVDAKIEVRCDDVQSGSLGLTIANKDLSTTTIIDVGGRQMTLRQSAAEVYLADERGEPIVDTRNGLHTEFGATILAGAEPELEPEVCRVDRLGVELEGAAATSLVGGMAGTGLYAVDLPQKPVRVGDVWTSARKISKLGTIQLSEPIEVPVLFKLVELRDGGRIAVVTSLVDEPVRDIDGDIAAGPAAGGKLHIDVFQLNATGRAEVSVADGIPNSVTVHGTMTMKGSMSGLAGQTFELSVQADVPMTMTRRAAVDPPR